MSYESQQLFNPIFTRPPMVQFDRPTVRTTFQLAASLSPKTAVSEDDVFAGAIRSTLQWIQESFAGPLPDEAWEGESFVAKEGDEKVETIAISEEGIWSLRWSRPDHPSGDQPAIEGRSWITGVALRQTGENVRAAVRVQCASRAYATEDIPMTRPRIVLDWAYLFRLEAARVLDGTPWVIEEERELDELLAFLQDPRRKLPVYLLTETESHRHHQKVARFLLNETRLAERTLGMAHVVAMPKPPLGFAWTDRVGKDWTAFWGAVRTYRPGLDFEKDVPTSHPLMLADKVEFFKQGDRIGETAFEDFLVQQAQRHVATMTVDWGGCLFFVDARARRAEVSRAKAMENSDWRRLYEEENEALRKKIEEMEKEAEAYLDDAIHAAEERDYYAEENRKLRTQVLSLRQALESKTDESADKDIEIPDNYQDLPGWVEKHFAGRLVLHPRALRGLKEANYENVELVYQALILLGDKYHKSRLGYEGANQAFEEGLKELGLRYSGSIDKNRAGEQGAAYFVKYPPYSNESRFLEWHLRKGNSRDARHCMAIYFFWHEDTQEVVVGWLPGHLDNRMT